MRFQNLVFITGNEHKAAQLAAWLGLPIEHQKLDLEEVQSLDVREIAERKARAAYKVMQRPVLVEDCSLIFTALGQLPGPLVKWFEKGTGLEGMCRMLDGFSDRSAVAQIFYVLFDGTTPHFFEGVMRGTVPEHPGENQRGFGFDRIFVNEGQERPRSELDEATYAALSYRKQAQEKLKAFLTAND
ncbi:MAG TPA: non-canonical purine NTP pyrophosphatase [Candidatus Saccharimonadales bacterium]|nr:non-canonical purine NTP pyrophosphatase [Candidatus Saccharimonadales bacterium]